MATVIATDPAARKRKGTERGGTETKRRDDTSPPAGKQSKRSGERLMQTLQEARNLISFLQQGNVERKLDWCIDWIAVVILVLRNTEAGRKSANLYNTVCQAYKDMNW